MTKRQRVLVVEAMSYLQDMPCGGIGVDGATEAELLEGEMAGNCVGNDAAYHRAQRAWLKLRASIGGYPA